MAATNSCEMPGYEMPTMPTLPFATHGCAATVSIASYPSSDCNVSKKSQLPPEQPVPRMFTPTVAKPSRLAIDEAGCRPRGFDGS